MFENLTNENFEAFAMHHYNNDQFSHIEEFHEDMKLVKYIKRLLRRYHTQGILRTRLILNHMIIFFNVFPPRAGVRMLFLKFEPELHPYLKTFLVYLDYMPENIPGINNSIVDGISISMDQNIIDELRKI